MTAAMTTITPTDVVDVDVDATTGSKLVLAGTHLIAAAIVVPALAARLSH